jgi:hypothetical protein
MSSPRPTRNAPRYQSPFLPINNTRSESARSIAESANKKRTLIDDWLEPALAPPKPSFAEAGIERHGVLSTMAPLGTLPSAKILKAAAKEETQDAVGRVGMVKKSGASSVSATPSESMHTPEPTTQQSTRQSSAPAATATATAAATVEETIENPPPPPSTEPVVAPTPPALNSPPIARTPSQTPRPQSQGTPYGQSVFALNRSISDLPRPVPQPVIPPPMNVNGEYGIDLRITDRVVESAVQRALDERRWPTAYALRTLYDDHRLNPRMVRLIDAIYNRRADEDQRREFAAVMSHKKKEGKKDRTGEYYFNGDGSDPLPPRAPIFSAANARTPSFSTPSGRSATGARSMSDTQARRSSFPSLSASPYKEADSSLHVNKKHKGNDFQAPPDLEIAEAAANEDMEEAVEEIVEGDIEGDIEGDGVAAGEVKAEEELAQENRTPDVAPRSRTHSMSSSSSLSSLDEAVIGSGNFSNTASPLHKAKDSSNNANHAEGLGHGLGHGLGLGGVGGDAHAHNHTHHKPKTGSPRFINGNTNTTSATETHPSRRNHSQPITAPPKLGGPKTFTFSTVNSSSAGALPSSTNNPANAKADHQRRPSSSTSSSMAPTALIPSSKNPSASGLNLPTLTIFKTKKDPSKVLARAEYEEDAAGRVKRKARERARDFPAPSTESFMRHQVPLPDIESVSDGGDSVTGSRPSKRPKVRLLNNKKTRQSQTQSVNYDSDTLSSPTLLSFQPDQAPGSLSASRAGTPNPFGRPTRKAKTGTGLRVKTS